MFLWTASTENLLRYRLSPWETLDRVTVSILNQGVDLPMVPAGVTEEGGFTDILLPVSGYMTLERAVTETDSARAILHLFERAASVYREASKRMIPVSEILFLPDTILVEKATGKLKLLCIPVVSEYGRRKTVKRTFLSLAGAALTETVEDGEYLLLFLRGLNGIPEREAADFVLSFNRRIIKEESLKEKKKNEERQEKRKETRKGLLDSIKERKDGEGASERRLMEFLESPGMNFEQWLEEN